MKKLISLILVVLLVFSCCPIIGIAAQTEPIVVVSGMGSFPLYSSDGTQVWGPNGDIIKNTVVSSLKGTVSTGKLVDSILSALKDEMFCYLSCDENGKSIMDVSSPKFPLSVDNYPDDFANSDNNEDEVGIIKALSKKFGAENVWFFNYDWRLNPLDHADDLNAFIKSVKQQSGADKVTLIPCSMGGEVTDAYLYKYDAKQDVSKIIFSMVASHGLDMVGELFGKKINITTDMLLERLFNFDMSNLLTEVLVGILDAGVTISGIAKPLDYIIDKVVSGINEKAYSMLLLDTFATNMSLWGFVKDDCYEQDKAAMYGDDINKVFEANIDEYHYNVLNKADDIVRSCINDGMDIYVLASYGYVGIPVTELGFEQSDCLIETANESFGATTANFGEQFPASYKALGTVCSNSEHTHVSVDGVIDASTCAFPEQTWFIKNNRHVGMNCNTDCANIMAFLVETDGATVTTDESYPQFIELNPVSGKFTSLTGTEIKTQSKIQKIFSKLIIIFNTLVAKIKKLLNK